ncbi:MAG: TlpA family protein disulfide reductase [Ruminococcus sp.]|nr:TlpA family protein disulfide reductase [Ruminococcus sp.]
MKNKIKILITMLVAMAVVLGAFALFSVLSDDNEPVSDIPSGQGSGSNHSSQGATSAAPDFVVYDADGNQVRLSDFAGKPVVVNFWASWCPPCKSEMPEFEAKYLELGDEVAFLMVNMTDNSRETVQTASDYIAAQGYTFPVYYDTAGSAATLYSVYSIPATYFIDAQGNLVANASGAIDSDTLQKGIDMITG